MSHITKVIPVDEEGVELNTNDLDAWELTAQVFGGTLMRGQKTYQCFEGGWVGDTHPPDGWDPSMWGKCEHAIKIPGCKWEIGLVKLGDKLTPIFDYYRSDDLVRVLGGPKAPKLIKAYADALPQAEQTRARVHAAKVRNWPVQQRLLPNNVIELRVRII